MMPAFIAALSALLGVLVLDTRPGFSIGVAIGEPGSNERSILGY